MANTLPDRFFKYLPQQFVAELVDRGGILFRSLSHFRQLEDKGKGDLLEGLHMDRPDTPVTITTLDGRQWSGQAAMLNRINDDRTLVFCLSTRFDPALFDEFSADACVEIANPAAFIDRATRTVARQRRFASSGLLHGHVAYYAPNRALAANVRDVHVIPFVKHESYTHQSEYRLIVALDRGLRLKTQIVNELFTWDKELASSKPTERLVRIGSIRDVSQIHLRTGSRGVA